MMAKTCAMCGKDISDRGRAAKFCVSCNKKRKRMQSQMQRDKKRGKHLTLCGRGKPPKYFSEARGAKVHLMSDGPLALMSMREVAERAYKNGMTYGKYVAECEKQGRVI